jgi:hypothetical protein
MTVPRYRLDSSLILDDTFQLGPAALEAKLRAAMLLLPAHVRAGDIEVTVRELDPGEEPAGQFARRPAFAEMGLTQQLTHLRVDHDVHVGPDGQPLLEMERLGVHRDTHAEAPANHVHIDQEEP